MTTQATETRYGYLTDYQTGEPIRPATLEELERSLDEGDSGTFCDDAGRIVYVDRSHAAEIPELREDLKEALSS